MKKIFLIISFCSLISASGLLAQSQSKTGIINFAWEINVPLNNKNFISDVSLPGARLESRWFINPNLSFGVELEWFSMYEYTPKQTYHLTGNDVTTDLYKYMYMVPMTASLHYYPTLGSDKVLPFLGVYAGAAYCEPSLYFNIYQITDDNWGFTFKPELGAIVPLGSGDYGISLSARYNYATNKFEGININNVQTISFQIGLALLR